VSREPIHLHPTAPLAERVLLPGDPGRALLLAQELLEEPKMFNHNRGLWGYTGTAKADGELMTIQSTGLGGPSAAIVLSELAGLGVRRAVRVGTCSALAGSGLGLGDVVAVAEAIAADGASRALGAGERVRPDAALHGRLPAAPAVVVSTDLFYDAAPERARAWREAGATVRDLQTATLLAAGAALGVAVASVVAVVAVDGDEQRLTGEPLREAAERVGRAGLAALVET
jgi:uridine phosphorylase